MSKHIGGDRLTLTPTILHSAVLCAMHQEWTGPGVHTTFADRCGGWLPGTHKPQVQPSGWRSPGISGLVQWQQLPGSEPELSLPEVLNPEGRWDSYQDYVDQSQGCGGWRGHGDTCKPAVSLSTQADGPHDERCAGGDQRMLSLTLPTPVLLFTALEDQPGGCKRASPGSKMQKLQSQPMEEMLVYIISGNHGLTACMVLSSSLSTTLALRMTSMAPSIPQPLKPSDSYHHQRIIPVTWTFFLKITLLTHLLMLLSATGTDFP